MNQGSQGKQMYCEQISRLNPSEMQKDLISDHLPANQIQKNPFTKVFNCVRQNQMPYNQNRINLPQEYIQNDVNKVSQENDKQLSALKHEEKQKVLLNQKNNTQYENEQIITNLKDEQNLEKIIKQEYSQQNNYDLPTQQNFSHNRVHLQLNSLKKIKQYHEKCFQKIQIDSSSSKISNNKIQQNNAQTEIYGNVQMVQIIQQSLLEKKEYDTQMDQQVASIPFTNENQIQLLIKNESYHKSNSQDKEQFKKNNDKIPQIVLSLPQSPSSSNIAIIQRIICTEPMNDEQSNLEVELQNLQQQSMNSNNKYQLENSFNICNNDYIQKNVLLDVQNNFQDESYNQQQINSNKAKYLKTRNQLKLKKTIQKVSKSLSSDKTNKSNSNSFAENSEIIQKNKIKYKKQIAKKNGKTLIANKKTNQKIESRYFMRNKAQNQSFEFMQLDKQNKPQSIEIIDNFYQWNFSGKPIREIIQSRQLQKMSKKKFLNCRNENSSIFRKKNGMFKKQPNNDIFKKAPNNIFKKKRLSRRQQIGQKELKALFFDKDSKMNQLNNQINQETEQSNEIQKIPKLKILYKIEKKLTTKDADEEIILNKSDESQQQQLQSENSSIEQKDQKIKRNKIDPSSKYFQEEIKNYRYKCKFCPIRFKICSALGGHISKAHPGLSEAYNHKKTVRENRELERDLHKSAMDQYILQEKNQAILAQIEQEDLSNVNRNTIKRIKKQIVQYNEKYSKLKKKFLGNKESFSEINFEQESYDEDQKNENSQQKQKKIDYQSYKQTINNCQKNQNYLSKSQESTKMKQNFQTQDFNSFLNIDSEQNDSNFKIAQILNDNYEQNKKPPPVQNNNSIYSSDFDILKQISMELNNDPMNILNNLDKNFNRMYRKNGYKSKSNKQSQKKQKSFERELDILKQQTENLQENINLGDDQYERKQFDKQMLEDALMQKAPKMKIKDKEIIKKQQQKKMKQHEYQNQQLRLQRKQIQVIENDYSFNLQELLDDQKNLQKQYFQNQMQQQNINPPKIFSLQNIKENNHLEMKLKDKSKKIQKDNNNNEDTQENKCKEYFKISKKLPSIDQNDSFTDSNNNNMKKQQILGFGKIIHQNKNPEKDNSILREKNGFQNLNENNSIDEKKICAKQNMYLNKDTVGSFSEKDKDLEQFLNDLKKKVSKKKNVCFQDEIQ